MKNKLLCILGFLVFAFMFMFSNTATVSANDTITIDNYARFRVTLTDVVLHPYTCNYSEMTCTLDKTKSKTVDFVFETMAPNEYWNSSSGGTVLTSAVTKNTIMFNSFEVLSFDPNYSGSNSMTVLASDMRMYELYDMLRKFAHDFGVVYELKDVVENEYGYIVPNMIFIDSRSDIGLYNYALDVSNRSEIQPLYNQLADIFNNSTNVVNVSDIDYDSGYETGFNEGKASVDITTDNQAAIDNYIEENNLHTNDEYLEYGNEKYELGFDDGVESVDITVDNEEIYNNGFDDGKTLGIAEGKASVDITIDNQTAIENYINQNSFHTHEDYIQYGKDRYQLGFDDGVESVDITTDNADVYNEGFDAGKLLGIDEGKASVDITTDNQAAIDNYIEENNLHTNDEYLEYGNEKYELGFDDGVESVDITTDNVDAYNKGFNAGVESVDITTDNKEAYDNGYNTGYKIGYDEGQASIDIESIRSESYSNGFREGQISVDITSDNQEVYDRAYQEGYDDAYMIGYYEGIASVDVESLKKEAYDIGYSNGYNIGFAEGEYSVDITSDNDTVIDLYIKQNKYHTDWEFNLNFELGYSEGINFVYKNIESDKVVTKYVKDYIYLNKYYTNTEYINNYNEGYQTGYSDGYNYGYNEGIVDGKEVVYKNITSDPIVKEYYKEKLVNNTNITFQQDGYEKVYVVKNYIINETDTGDFTIVIRNGQDNYKIETVEEVIPGKTETIKESNNYDGLVNFFTDFGIALLIFIGTIGLIWLIKAMTNIIGARKGNGKYDEQMAY